MWVRLQLTNSSGEHFSKKKNNLESHFLVFLRNSDSVDLKQPCFVSEFRYARTCLSLHHNFYQGRVLISQTRPLLSTLGIYELNNT